MEETMKRKLKNKNSKQTVAWLTHTIDAELARGDAADDQLIRECTEYLQELSPETTVPAEVTEQYLQAELCSAEIAPCAVHRRAPRVALKFTLRLAAVLCALALFCTAIPVVAAQVLNDNVGVEGTPEILKPVVELLTHTVEPKSIDYPSADDYEQKPGYTATYKTTKEMLIKEQPADVLCLHDLPESLGEYDIRVIHYSGKTTSEKWKINWSAKDNRWGYLVRYCDTRYLSSSLNRPDYERSYERYSVNGRTYFYKVNTDGSYWATCIQGRIQYSVLAPDLETMTLLIDHAVSASEIIPAASPTLPLLSPDQFSPLDRHTVSDTVPSRPQPLSNAAYLAYYETTEDFLKSERVDILTVNDRASELLDCQIRVLDQIASQTSHEWSVNWQAENGKWTFGATYDPNRNMEANAKAYEQFPQYYEPYTVDNRTFYITAIHPSAHVILLGNYNLLANYFEGNICYYINATDRETLELVINNLVQANAE